MFNIFKRDQRCLVAPVSGQLISLENVKDEVFASGMMGPGLAIEPVTSTFVAPADGKIILIAETKHAFAMRLKDGVEILVHIGLNTTFLKGKGFKVLVKEGDVVKRGTPIIEADLGYFRDENCVLQTPIIILNDAGKKMNLHLQNKECTVGKTSIIYY